MSIPAKTIERLSQYRRILLNCVSEGKKNIFSHELASLIHSTPVQIRRDFMLIGYSGSQSKGYEISALIELISKILDTQEGQNVAVVGIGNIGRAIVRYFVGKRSKLSIVAGFDTDPEKVDRVIAGVRCYHIDKMTEIIKEKNISIAVIAVTSEAAEEISKKLVASGIKGILNFTSAPLRVPEKVYLDEFDFIASLEKAAYFSK